MVISAITHFFYDGSIVEAHNGQAIHDEYEKNKHLSFIERFSIGCSRGIKSFSRSILIMRILPSKNKIVKSLKNSNANKINPLIDSIIVAPLLEEIVFRLILQNLILSQIYPFRNTFSKEQQDEYQEKYKKYTDITKRIIITGTLFSIVHYPIKSKLLGQDTAIKFITTLILFPDESVAYEKYGFGGSLGLHMTHNLLCALQQFPLALLDQKC